jgi:hypothetical protein
VNGIAGGMRAAVALGRARYVASNSVGATITMDGQTVNVITGSGVPQASAAGIGVALAAPNDWTVSADPADPTNGSVTWTPPGGGATCDVVYTAPTGNVVTTVTGC